MSLSDRRAFLASIAVLTLAGCGFSPAFAPGKAASDLRGKVRADDPDDRDAFDFVAALEDRLGRPESPRFALAYTIGVSDSGVGFTTGGTATRRQLTGSVDYTLTDTATGEILASGQVRDFASYSTTSTQLATLTASEDARRRLMRMLADGLATRLLATVGTNIS